jgi:hypothetical protein
MGLFDVLMHVPPGCYVIVLFDICNLFAIPDTGYQRAPLHVFVRSSHHQALFEMDGLILN